MKIPTCRGTTGQPISSTYYVLYGIRASDPNLGFRRRNFRTFRRRRRAVSALFNDGVVRVINGNHAGGLVFLFSGTLGFELFPGASAHDACASASTGRDGIDLPDRRPLHAWCDAASN
jgi:hypothetical protein